MFQGALCTHYRYPGASNGGLQRGPCEERPGLPLAGHSRFQPAGLPQGRAEPLSHGGGTSAKMYLKKGRTCQTGKGEEEKNPQTNNTSQRREPRDQRVRGRCAVLWRRYSLQPVEGLGRSRWVLLKELRPVESHTLEQGLFGFFPKELETQGNSCWSRGKA